MSEGISDDLTESLGREGSSICEDAFVYFWNNGKTWGAYTGLTSAPFTSVVTRWNGGVNSLCPTSGRFVSYAGNSSSGNDDDDVGDFDFRKIVVVDLF